MPSKGHTKNKNGAADLPEMPSWLTDFPASNADEIQPIDAWLVNAQDDILLANKVREPEVSEADERRVVSSVEEVSLCESSAPPAATSVAVSARVEAADWDSDTGEDVIITDTTFVDEDPLLTASPHSEPAPNSAATDEDTGEGSPLKPPDAGQSDVDPFGHIDQFVVNDDTVLLVTEAAFRAYIWGAYQVCVLRGSVTIDGAVLTVGRAGFVPVYALRVRAIAPITGSGTAEAGPLAESSVRDACPAGWQTVQACLQEMKPAGCALLVRRLPSRLLSLLAEKHAGQFTPAPADDGDMFAAATGCRLLTEAEQMQEARVSPYLSCPQRDQLVSDLVDHTGPLRVALVGGKDVGKSTLLYRLLNSLLTRHRHVFVLDCDPGQAEFTPCACLSLLKLSQPQLGPSFTHLQQPLRSIFTGEVSVANDPAGYLLAVQQLSGTYRSLVQRDTAPLLVNTMGWVKDLGQDLVLEVLANVQPSHVVELVHPTKDHSNFADRLTPEWVNGTPRSWLLKRLLSQETPPRPDCSYRHHRLTALVNKPQRDPGGGRPADDGFRMAPWMSRQLSTTAMVAALEEPGRPLCQLVPVWVAWSSLALRVRAQDVMPQHLLHAVNGCVVALCLSDPASWLTPQQHDMFSLLPDNAPPPDCLGFGLVRGVDWQRRLLYLLTSVSEKQLQTVNTLVRGPHHLLDVFPRQSGLPVWAPALTSDAGPLNRPNLRNKARRYR